MTLLSPSVTMLHFRKWIRHYFMFSQQSSEELVITDSISCKKNYHKVFLITGKLAHLKSMIDILYAVTD